MRIVFLGTPEFALPILETCARVGQLVGVIVQPIGRWDDREASGAPAKQWALERGLPVDQPEKVKQGRLAAALSRYTPDVAVVAAYGRILPADALRFRCMGASTCTPRSCPSFAGPLRPSGRGAGYKRTGVTIMQMDEGLDTGDIRLQRPRKIAADETGESLLRKLSPLGAGLLGVALRRLERGELLRYPQDHSRATLAPMLTREDGRADFPAPRSSWTSGAVGSRPGRAPGPPMPAKS